MRKEERLLSVISNIDADIIEEADAPAAGRRTSRPVGFILLAAAVVLLAAATAAAAMLAGRMPGAETPAPASDAVSSGVSETEEGPPEKDYSPVPISSLSIPEAKARPDLRGGSEADIGPFREEYVAYSCAILEGKVTKVYPMEYTYKFKSPGEKNGEKWETVTGKTWTVVYELEIGKVWYGDGFSVGQTVVIEDEWNGSCDETLAPAEGRTYVFPIGKRTDNEFSYLKFVRPRIEGEVTGETEFSSPYGAIDSFYIKITKTDDGEYLVYTGYPTLTAEPCRHVIIDDESVLGGITSYFTDKIRLLDGEEFAARMDEMIEKYLRQK